MDVKPAPTSKYVSERGYPFDGMEPSSPPLSPLPPPPPPPPRDPPLPPGWEELHDPESRRPYYVHRATGQVVWARPVPAPDRVAEVLPPTGPGPTSPHDFGGGQPMLSPHASWQDPTPDTSLHLPPRIPDYYQAHPSPYEQTTPLPPHMQTQAPYTMPGVGSVSLPSPQPPHLPRPQEQLPSSHHAPHSFYPAPYQLSDNRTQVPPPGAPLSPSRAPQQPGGLVPSFTGLSVAPSVARVSSLESNLSNALQNAKSLGMTPDGVSSVVGLEMSAKGLRNKDIIGKSDPVVVVSMQGPGGKWVKVGMTEVIENNLNPHWQKRVEVNYVFEKVQNLRFDVYDVDGKTDGKDGTRLQTQFLGQLIVPLGDLLTRGSAVFDLTGKPGQAYSVSGAGKGKGFGRFCVRVHESNSFHRVHVTLGAENLDRANGIFGGGLSDPYVTIKQLSDDSGQKGVNVLARSEHVVNSLNPKWEPMSFDVVTGAPPFTNVNLELELKDWNKRSEHIPLGAVRCTLEELMNKKSFPVFNDKKRRRSKKSDGSSGTVHVQSIAVVPYPSHVEFLQGGCHLRAMFAVDMTSTGGLPTDAKSPHFIGSGRGSLYAQALKSVGDVVTPYLPDDQMMSAYAFGAEHQNSGGAVSHAFPLNPAAWNTGDARVMGSQSLVDSYVACVQCAKLSTPTCFSEVLQCASDFSISPTPTQQDQHYTVLFVLTSGGCSDMDDTIRKICTASENAPLSVVFIGVGEREDWSEMEYLDGDGGRLPQTRDGVRAKRDIVDFVQYDPKMSAEALAAEVLREVPKALREYFAERKIRPNPPPQGELMSANSRGSYYC